MSNAPEIILNEAEQRFELHIDGHMAYEVFERFPGGSAYLHTIVPMELEGRGVACVPVQAWRQSALPRRGAVRRGGKRLSGSDSPG